MNAEAAASVDIIAPLEQEGTRAVVKSWYKAVGDRVSVDEAIVELETDKVLVEVSAPSAGVLREVFVESGKAATPGQLLGRIESAKQVALASAMPVTTPVEPPPAAASATPRHGAEEQRWSPAVRRLIFESGIDVSGVRGSGRGGRLTRQDIALEIEKRASAPQSVAANGSSRIPHNSQRRRIAEHMSASLAVAPHITAIFEADFSAIIRHRQIHREEFERQNVRLTFTAYIVQACVAAMQAVPIVNSRWHEDYLEVFSDVNVGVGTALGENGLIVPVVHKANALSLLDTARRLTEMTERARCGKLTTADVRGGTFTISNHGVSGSLLAAPIIINQPQNAILGVGKVEKRFVVREVDGVDTIHIRPLAFVSLSIDHRALDGAQTNAWLSRFVTTLERWPA